ncbi:MAG: PAS domain S-box protein [Proteobacteria bacterium]|nr:PAS domain S-box protein [Pseudomonadota bacterium]MBU1650411.1 PAS domain S-box protein [Pseudomonadota bacterium]
MAHTASDSDQELRQKAEAKLRASGSAIEERVSPEEAKLLLHELQVHQIELEMQNEELRQAQQKLETLRASYFDLYNLAPVGYLTLDNKGLIIQANLTCANLLGMTRGEIVKRPLSHFIFPEDQDIYYLHRKEVAQAEGPHVCELRMIRADGSLIWVTLQAISAEDIDGTSGCRMVMSDCTRQKQAEIEVRTIKEQWEKTFDAIDDVVTLHDLNMRIIRANKAAGVLFQLAPAELVGRYCYELFRGASKPCSGCPENRIGVIEAHQRANIHHENLGKTFDVAAYPLVDETGLVGFVSVARDITEHLQLEEQLKQSRKMETIGTLAGGIAHDFNNILVPILGYAELAAERITPDDPLATDLRQIVKAALRAKDMISRILSFSRQSPQAKYPFQPHLVVLEALKLLQASLPATIEVKTEIDANCGTILADPTQFYQIVMNLCTNAYHAMLENGGMLRVSLAEVSIDEEKSKALGLELVPGDYIVLEVSDTGIGMERKVLERIFDPYFSTRAGKGVGTGLGLTVVQGIVKGYQGQITVQSELGKGTSFQVYIPIAGEESSQKRAVLVPKPTGTESILVVDDEEDNTGMFQAILTGLGYQVVGFNNSLEALAFFTKVPTAFDLLLTDMTMPHMTGLELSKKVLAIRPDLPIILCSGFSQLVNKEQIRALGIKGYLKKPVAVRDLALAIRKALDKKGKTA